MWLLTLPPPTLPLLFCIVCEILLHSKKLRHVREIVRGEWTIKQFSASNNCSGRPIRCSVDFAGPVFQRLTPYPMLALAEDSKTSHVPGEPCTLHPMRH